MYHFATTDWVMFMHVSIANTLTLFHLTVTSLMAMSVAVLIRPQVHGETRDHLAEFLCQLHVTEPEPLVETIRQSVEEMTLHNNFGDDFTCIAVALGQVGRKRQDVIPELAQACLT